jgi:phosphate-selective porin
MTTTTAAALLLAASALVLVGCNSSPTKTTNTPSSQPGATAGSSIPPSTGAISQATAASSVENIEGTLKGQFESDLSQFESTHNLSAGQAAATTYVAAATALAAVNYPNAATKGDAVAAENDLNETATMFEDALNGQTDSGSAPVATALTTLNTDLGLPPYTDIAPQPGQ